MKYWTASFVAMLLSSFLAIVSVQVDCNAVPAGPARTDCYIDLSRVYRGQRMLPLAMRACSQMRRVSSR